MEYKFWQGDILRGFIQYLSAGLAAVPGGVLYAFLLRLPNRGVWTFALSLTIAVSCGFAAWHATGHLLRAREKPPVPRRVVVSTNASFIGSALWFPAATGTMAMIVTCAVVSGRGGNGNAATVRPQVTASLLSPTDIPQTGRIRIAHS
jgi:hypothetical protein